MLHKNVKFIALDFSMRVIINNVFESHMSKRSPVAIFLAASAFLSLNTVQSEASKASEHKEKDRMELGHQEIDEQKYAFHHKRKITTSIKTTKS